MLKKSINIFFLLGLISNTALYTMNKEVAVRSSKRLREKEENKSNKRPKMVNAIVLDNAVDCKLLRLQPTMQDIKRGNIYASLEPRKQVAELPKKLSKIKKQSLQNVLLTPESKFENIVVTTIKDSSVQKFIPNSVGYINNNHIWQYFGNRGLNKIGSSNNFNYKK